MTAIHVIHVILVCGMVLLSVEIVSAQTNPPAGLPRSPQTVQRSVDIRLKTRHFATNIVVAEVETGPEIPEAIAIIVEPVEASNNSSPRSFSNLQSNGINKARRLSAFEAMAQEEAKWAQAKWIPYAPTVSIDLGPEDGQRMIWTAGRWSGRKYQTANGVRVEVQRTPSLVVITDPPEGVSSRPMIQLKGYSVRALQSIRYDVANASNQVENGEGLVNDTVTDFNVAGLVSTNFFTCYDIDLVLGTNTINLRCEDLAGNVTTNTLTYVLDLSHDKVPPVISPDWPLEGTSVMGQTVRARGRLDDPTARITGHISAAGKTNEIEGLVERNGYYWVEDMPLSLGTNYLSLIATDAAGNRSSTNFCLQGREGTLVMDPVPPDELWHSSTTVTGKVDPPNQDVWINGVQATVRIDGTWTATNVPIRSPNGGTACFEMTATPSGEKSPW